jgi:hypothetical protein
METLLDLRTMLMLLVASLLLGTVGANVYRRDPDRRRLLLAVLAAVLAVAPWWAPLGLWTFPVGLPEPTQRLLGQPIPAALLAVWWVIAALLLLRTGARVLHGRYRLARLPMLRNPTIERQAHAIAAALGLRRRFRLMVGAAPCTSSIGPAVIVLPPAAHRWNTGTVAAVLAHEIVHLQRHDDVLRIAMRLLSDWYWWLPWLRTLQHRFSDAMEESCDRRASSLLPSREAYVEGVLSAVRSLRARASGAPGTGAWAAPAALLGHSHLTHRADRLLRSPAPSLDHADGRWRLLYAGLAVALLITAQPAVVSGGAGTTGALLLSLDGHEQTAIWRSSSHPAGSRDTTHGHVTVRNRLRQGDDPIWRALPSGPRDPLPVYPAKALRDGLEGTVIVEFPLDQTGAAVTLGTPTITSSDPTGTLAGAVVRALDSVSRTDLGAPLRAVPAPGPLLRPAPGARVRQEFRFVLATPPAIPATTAGE